MCVNVTRCREENVGESKAGGGSFETLEPTLATGLLDISLLNAKLVSVGKG